MSNGDLGEMRHEQPARAQSASGIIAGRREMEDLLDMFEQRRPMPKQVISGKGQLVAILLALVSPIVTIAGGGYFMTGYWRAEDVRVEAEKTKATEVKTIRDEQEVSKRERAETRASLDTLRNDRSVRIREIDGWRDKVEDELRIYRVGYSDFRKLEGRVEKIDDALSAGRAERLSDRDRMLEAINSLKTEVALLRQSVEAARRGDGPFDRNQMWRGLPSLLNPSPLIPIDAGAVEGRFRRVAEAR